MGRYGGVKWRVCHVGVSGGSRPTGGQLKLQMAINRQRNEIQTSSNSGLIALDEFCSITRLPSNVFAPGGSGFWGRPHQFLWFLRSTPSDSMVSEVGPINFYGF